MNFAYVIVYFMNFLKIEKIKLSIYKTTLLAFGNICNWYLNTFHNGLMVNFQ